MGLTLALGLVLGYTFYAKDYSVLIQNVNTDSQTQYSAGEVETVINLIDRKYLLDIDRKQLVESAVKSTFTELDDYSVYINAEDSRASKFEMNSKYKGLGIEMMLQNDTIVVTYSKPESFARTAGLDYGDRLLQINDRNVTGDSITFTTVRNEVTASKEYCKVTFLDHQTQNTLSKDIELMEVINPDASINMVLNDSVGVIKIKHFNDDTYAQFMQSLERLDSITNQNLHLIIDVRDNPGGYLPQVLKILDQLVYEKDILLLKTKDREKDLNTYYSKAKNFFMVKNIAVLINENSASASEILAGVLQDLDCAIILGEESFGKGLVQEQYNLPSGSQMRLTVSEYILPSGRGIHKWSRHGKLGQEICDSTTQELFKTRFLRREVVACSGIVPDVVGPTKASCDVSYKRVYNVSFDYDSVEDVEANFDAILSEYNLQLSQSCKSDFLEDLEYVYTKRTIGLDEAEYNLLKQDPLVLLAVDKLQTGVKAVLKQPVN